MPAMYTFSRRYLFFAGNGYYRHIFPGGLPAQEKSPVIVFLGVFWTFTGAYLAPAKVQIVIVVITYN
jgi:hypothetical protein